MESLSGRHSTVDGQSERGGGRGAGAAAHHAVSLSIFRLYYNDFLALINPLFDSDDQEAFVGHLPAGGDEGEREHVLHPQRGERLYVFLYFRVSNKYLLVYVQSFQTVQGTEDLIDQILLSHNYLKTLSLEHKARCHLVASIAQCMYDSDSGTHYRVLT